MISELQTAYESAKAALIIAKGIQNLKNDVELKLAISPLVDNIISLQSRISEAQAKYDEILADNKRLKEELANRDSWEDKAACYERQTLETGVTLYVMKPSGPTPKPTQYACPACYEEHKESILQPTYPGGGEYACHCGRFKGRVRPVPKQVPAPYSGGIGGFTGL